MSFEPRIVGYLCNWCSYAGADLAGVSRFQYPPTIRAIRVMCSTRVEPSYILTAFLHGADGVLVGGCHLGDCHYITGNYYTIRKVNMARRLLKHAGIDERRLRLEWISASEGERFAQVVTEFTEELKKLGPLPEEERNSISLKAALRASMQPRLRIIATKEKVFTEEGNKYGEIFTQHETERLANSMVWDELNEQKILLVLEEGDASLKDIAEKVDLPIDLTFKYIMDLLRRGRVVQEMDKEVKYALGRKKEKEREMPIFSSIEGNGKGIVIIGAGVGGIKKAIEIAKEKRVYIVERFPSITKDVIKRHKSSLKEYDDVLPKLKEMVEKGKICIVGNSLVRDIEDGKVKIWIYPTRINENCDNCGICEEVCPVKIIDRENGIFYRKAVYGRDGIPSTYFLEKETPFCQTGCPAHVDVRSYVAKIADGDFEGSLEIIRKRLPLPAVLGRVCPHPCETFCKRQALEKPISIRLLKRFAADWVYEQKEKIELPEPPENENGKYKVAIIGSGPAGLTAAHDLAMKGYKVTIFESLPVAGGMLAVGIPDYRLPHDVLEKEIKAILDLGIEIKLSTRVGKDISFDEIRRNFDAVFVAVGAHKGKEMGIEGEDLKGVIRGVDFLRDVNLSPESAIAAFRGRKMVVIGGGDVAIDAARCALRIGCEEVTILYRRSRKEMPAREEEIRFAEEEGVKIRYLVAPTRIIGKNGEVVGIECVEMELGEPDESGRRKPIPKEGSEFVLEVDTVISAIGQSPDFSFMPEVRKTKWNTIVIDEKTGATSMEGVFAGGDMVTGPSIVIEAVAAGRRAAEGIDAYLHGKKISFNPVESSVYRPIVDKHDISLVNKNVLLGNVEIKERREVDYIPLDERRTTFKEVEKGFTKEEAIEEAKRCLSCRECIGCGICANECPQNAIVYEENEKEIEIEADEVFIDPEIQENIINHPNILTPFEFEKMLEVSHPIRPSDGKVAKKIAFINENGESGYMINLMSKIKGSEIVKGIEIKKGKIFAEKDGKKSEYDLGVLISFRESEYSKELKRKGAKEINTR